MVSISASFSVSSRNDQAEYCCPWVGSTHGLGLVGSGWVKIFKDFSGLGWVVGRKKETAWFRFRSHSRSRVVTFWQSCPWVGSTHGSGRVW